MDTDTTFEPIDLDVDLQGIDTTIPVIKKGVYDFDISAMTKEENKDKNGFNLVVVFKTTDATESITEKEIAPGFPMKKWYPLQKKPGGSDKFDYRVGLAQLIDAALGTTMENRPKFSSGLIIGKRVRASLAVVENKEAGDGSFQNEIKRLNHPE